MHTNNKMATEDDVYDVVLASSSYLCAFGEFSCRRNRQTRRRRFWVRDVLRRQDDLGEYARLVQELRLGSDSFHRYFLMSTEQFEYVLGLTQFTSTNSVRGCVCAGTYDVVRRHTTSYVQKCAEIEHVSISAFHDVQRRTTAYAL